VRVEFTWPYAGQLILAAG
jgi:hypothetical protein